MSDAGRHQSTRTTEAAAAVVGLAGAVVLATTGSAAWAVLRVAIALAVGAGVIVALRAGPRTGGWVALLIGAVVLPAAGVVAADHLAARAVLRGGAAALCALGAVVLLVGGSRRLLRATPGWWRLLALPVAFLLLQLVMWPTAVAVLATNRAHAVLGAATPADHGLAYEDVTLRTADGVALAGWYVPSRNGAAVLLLHGAGSTRVATLDHAEELAAMGFGVLAIDARGHGASGGTAMDLGWYGSADVAPAVDWLLRRPDVRGERGIAVVGLSMGAEEAITAAASDERIRAVVAEGVGVRVAADAPPAGPLGDLVNRLQQGLTDVLTTAGPPMPLREAVAAVAPRPVLLIAGDGEQAEATDLAAVAPGSVIVWDADAGHTRALAEHPEEWRARVGAVLREALLGSG